MNRQPLPHQSELLDTVLAECNPSLAMEGEQR